MIVLHGQSNEWATGFFPGIAWHHFRKKSNSSVDLCWLIDANSVVHDRCYLTSLNHFSCFLTPYCHSKVALWVDSVGNREETYTKIHLHSHVTILSKMHHSKEAQNQVQTERHAQRVMNSSPLWTDPGIYGRGSSDEVVKMKSWWHLNTLPIKRTKTEASPAKNNSVRPAVQG